VYYKAIFSTFVSFKRPKLKITTNDSVFTRKVLSVVIGKGISFGGGYKITYNAKLDDGKFFIVIIGDVSIITYLQKLPWILTGKKIDHPKIQYLSTSKITLENLSDFDCFLEMDGEPSFTCPVEIKCLPGLISILKVD
jgi:diacylglycerol kinase family enzyme